MSTACRCLVFSRHHRSTHLFHAVVFVLCANSFVKGKRAVASDPRDPTTGGLRVFLILMLITDLLIDC